LRISRYPGRRTGGLYPAVLPGKQRASVDLGDLVLIMFQHGISTRKIQQVIETIYGTCYSHASIAKLARVAAEEIEAWRMRPLKNAYFSVIIDAVFLSRGRLPQTAARALLPRGPVGSSPRLDGFLTYCGSGS
jgi:transposase-like protein